MVGDASIRRETFRRGDQQILDRRGDARSSIQEFDVRRSSIVDTTILTLSLRCGPEAGTIAPRGVSRGACRIKVRGRSSVEVSLSTNTDAVFRGSHSAKLIPGTDYLLKGQRGRMTEKFPDHEQSGESPSSYFVDGDSSLRQGIR